MEYRDRTALDTLEAMRSCTALSMANILRQISLGRHSTIFWELQASSTSMQQSLQSLLSRSMLRTQVWQFSIQCVRQAGKIETEIPSSVACRVSSKKWNFSVVPKRVWKVPIFSRPLSTDKFFFISYCLTMIQS